MAASWFGSYTSAFAMLCASIALAVYLWLRLTSMLIAVVAAIAPAAALATAEMLKALGGSGRVSVSLWGAPSGHVAAVVGAATCASFAAAVHPYKRLSRALAGSIAVLAALMTWARVSTQAHSASEAVGGVIVGLGIGSLATVLIDVDAARLDQVRRNAQAPVNT